MIFHFYTMMQDFLNFNFIIKKICSSHVYLSCFMNYLFLWFFYYELSTKAKTAQKRNGKKKKPYPHEMKKSFLWQRDINRESWMKDVWKGK